MRVGRVLCVFALPIWSVDVLCHCTRVCGCAARRQGIRVSALPSTLCGVIAARAEIRAYSRPHFRSGFELIFFVSAEKRNFFTLLCGKSPFRVATRSRAHTSHCRILDSSISNRYPIPNSWLRGTRARRVRASHRPSSVCRLVRN